MEAKCIKPTDNNLTEDKDMAEKTQEKHIEREFETMSDEFFKAGSMNMYNNMKRTYDEYQHESLESIRRNRAYVDKVLSDSQALTTQAMQNAVETANAIGKQALRHEALAADRQWNVDEQGYTAADIIKAMGGDTTAQNAWKELVLAAVAEALNKK